VQQIVSEEGAKVALASISDDWREIIGEVANLIYYVPVLLRCHIRNLSNRHTGRADDPTI